jgi:molybdate transport system substrate-binding protein
VEIARRSFATGLGALAALRAAQAQGPGEPLVAAAADLKFALEDLAERFHAAHGKRLRLVFGSSGQLTTQIASGAPYELFLAADESFIERLAQRGLTRDAGALYAVGRIAIFAPHASALGVDSELDGLAAALQAGAVQRFAIANPEHAPYGRAAEEALRHRGLWERLRPALVRGENIAQAAQFAAAAGAQGGIIAQSLAISPAVAALGRSAPIAADWHRPLRQRMALLARAGAIAGAFHDFLQSDVARAVLARHGFELPPAP